MGDLLAYLRALAPLVVLDDDDRDRVVGIHLPQRVQQTGKAFRATARTNCDRNSHRRSRRQSAAHFLF